MGVSAPEVQPRPRREGANIVRREGAYITRASVRAGDARLSRRRCMAMVPALEGACGEV
jgi:hypothetical protein